MQIPREKQKCGIFPTFSQHLKVKVGLLSQRSKIERGDSTLEFTYLGNANLMSSYCASIYLNPSNTFFHRQVVDTEHLASTGTRGILCDSQVPLFRSSRLRAK